MTPQRSRKTHHPKPKPDKTHLRVALELTREEVRHLQARAKTDLRSIAGCAVELVERDLRKGGGGSSGRPVRGAGPGEHRSAYEIGLMLIAEQRQRLEAKSEREGRSLLSSVKRITVEGVRR